MKGPESENYSNFTVDMRNTETNKVRDFPKRLSIEGGFNMIFLLMPVFVFVKIGVTHFLIYYLTNRLSWKLTFGLSLYLTGIIAGLINFVVDWSCIYSFLFAKSNEGFKMGFGLFIYMSWLIVPVCYLVFLSIFYLIKKKAKKKMLEADGF
ncbi:hypothetical protein [Enterococcus silesiacus]|nr:hypothetical protein [Enterococcus silesiacus]